MKITATGQKEVESKLRLLGVDESYVFHASQVAAREIESFIGVPLDDYVSAISSGITQISSEQANIFESTEYGLGASITSPSLPDSVPAVESPCTAPTLSLLSELPPIRNQGARGTCVAFATVACYEHHLIKGGGAPPDMSEQYLYWDCKRKDGMPTTEGTWIRFAASCINLDGVCQETTWPYNPTIIPGNESQAPPPPRAPIEALGFRSPSNRAIPPNSVIDIKAELCADRCVAFSIPVYNSWYLNNYVKLTGELGLPFPGEVRVGGHAMCIMGYEDLPAQPEIGGGRFYIRNSWGTSTWAPNSRIAPGYGTIPYAYISRFCTEAYVVE